MCEVALSKGMISVVIPQAKIKVSGSLIEWSTLSLEVYISLANVQWHINKDFTSPYLNMIIWSARVLIVEYRKMRIIGHPYNYPPPKNPIPEFTIQFIEFTYCNDKFTAELRESKTTEYQPLINSIIAKGWNVAPLIVLAAGKSHNPHPLDERTRIKT